MLKRIINRYFTEFTTRKIIWYLPLRILWWNIWFYIPKKIENYNQKNCKNHFPDFMNRRGGIGTKIKPFLGYVFRRNENEAMYWKWWKHLVKYNKDN